MSVEQIGALGAGKSGVASGASGSKPYADLKSIGQDSTHFGSQIGGQHKDKNILGKLLGMAITAGSIVAALRFAPVRGLLGRMPGKDKALQFIGAQATKILKSGMGKNILTKLKNVPVVGKLIRDGMAGIIKTGRAATARIGASAAATASGSAAASNAVTTAAGATVTATAATVAKSTKGAAARATRSKAAAVTGDGAKTVPKRVRKPRTTGNGNAAPAAT